MERFGIFACGLAALLLACPAWAQQKYPQQWNMASASLGDDAGMNKFIDLLKQSKDCGCTHIMFNDGGWLRTPDDAGYLARVNTVKAAAKELGMELVPSVYNFGNSGRYLKIDPNLGAGLPVKDMPFVVKGKIAVPDPALAFDLSTIASKVVNGEYMMEFKVPRFMHYKLTMRTTAQPPSGEDVESLHVTGLTEMRWLDRTTAVSVKRGDEWVTTNTFNTLDSDLVRFRVVLKDLSIFKDVKVELAGPLLIVRRPMLPLVVTSEDGKTIYEEGKDFKKLVDPKIAAGSANFASDHDPNNIELTEASRIKDGQKLKVSFFHAYKIYNKNGITMEDPAVYKIMADDITNCTKVWAPAGYFMHFDEIRLSGWENPSVPPAKTLADITRRACDLIRKASPKATIYVWSDMYCPFGNAMGPTTDHPQYYLVKGTWYGSWEGLPTDVVILNWQSSAEGVKFFADRGQSQILCGYYDGRTTADMKTNITTWKQDSRDVKNILGFMYTQWGSGYEHMKEYFQLLDTYDQWKTPVN